MDELFLVSLEAPAMKGPVPFTIVVGEYSSTLRCEGSYESVVGPKAHHSSFDDD